MTRRPEDAIQRAVVNLLRLATVPGVSWFHVPNGGGRSRIEAAIMKGLGVRAGVPDLIIVANGKPHALELKTLGGRASVAQKQMMSEMTMAGVTCEVAIGVDQAVSTLTRWGVVRILR